MSGEDFRPEGEKEQNEQNRNIGAEMLAQMPTWRDHRAAAEQVKEDTKVPEGVRDARDYREYLAEQEARAKEYISQTEERVNEKQEILSSFENRLEANKGFYNELAENVAFLWCLLPDVDTWSRTHIQMSTEQRRLGEFYQKEFYAPAGYDREQTIKFVKTLHIAHAWRDARRMMCALEDGVEYADNIDDVLDSDTLEKPYEKISLTLLIILGKKIRIRLGMQQLTYAILITLTKIFLIE